MGQYRVYHHFEGRIEPVSVHETAQGARDECLRLNDEETNREDKEHLFSGIWWTTDAPCQQERHSVTQPVSSTRFIIYCVCGWRQDVSAETEADAIEKLRHKGWNYPQKDAEMGPLFLKGLCPECVEMNIDE